MKSLAYLFVPVIFCVIGYLILWGALQPVWGLVSAAASVLVSEEAPNFSTELQTIYDPEAAVRNPVPVYNLLNEVVDRTETVTEGEVYISGRDVEYPDAGTQYGNISCEKIGLDAPVYWYDTDTILSYGVGQSLASFLPGFGRAIILSGHNTTYFKCLEFIEEGDVIQFKTNYCDYEYTVTKIEVINEKELRTILASKGREENEELIMYTCWPFYAITGRKTDRLTVFAERTSGLNVKWRDLE